MSNSNAGKRTIVLSANTSWYLYNFRASTIRRFLSEGYRVVCLSPEDDFSQRLVEHVGCEWLPLNMDNKGKNPFKDIGLVLRFWQVYRLLRPVAAFHFTIKNNVYGTWAARLLGVPAINNVSGLGTAFIRKGIVGGIVRLLYKLSMPLAYKVFCQNEEDLHLLIENKLVPQDRLFLLPGSGVDLDAFHPGLLKPHEGEFRFLYAGRMLADKGLYELIAAVQALHAKGVHCSLWLCGFADVENVSAISEAHLNEWGQQNNIEWLGPSDNMASMYAQVDCVVLPSYREGMPRSLLEAGAMGLPVVATDVPGCRNIVSDGFNGLLCEVQSSESLQGALQRMLSMSDAERRAMGANGRARVSEKFSEAIVIEAAVDAVRSCEKL
ncbi:MAG: glycosyltransferase family 4 protein [Pseudomonadales bacterium]